MGKGKVEGRGEDGEGGGGEEKDMYPEIIIITFIVCSYSKLRKD